MLRKPVNRKEKLALIQSVLNGSFKIEEQRPPRHYLVVINNGVHEVMGMGGKGRQVMNAEEYAAWKGTLSEQDVNFVTIVKDYSEETPPAELTPTQALEWLEVKQYEDLQKASPLPSTAESKEIHIPETRALKTPVNASESYSGTNIPNGVQQGNTVADPAPVVAMEPYEVRRERRVRFADSFDELSRDSFLI